MEQQQFERLVELLEAQIQYLQALVSRLDQLDQSIHEVFLK